MVADRKAVLCGQGIAEAAAQSDPDRGAPPEGGIFTGNALFDGASGGTGGYNYMVGSARERRSSGS